MVLVTNAAVVRATVPEDASALGELHVTCWREAYADVLSPAFLAALDVDQRRQQWARRLATPSPGHALVAVVDEQVVGMAWSAPSRDDPPVREQQLVGLYVRVAHHGTGVGQALLDAALNEQPASLWMAQDNPRALAFYLRNRFALDGAHKTEPLWEDLAEVRLVR